jgi:[protein-PII] uridylyltransferase
MPDLTALDRFLEARSAMAERASLRAGLETCHELADALDAGLMQLAQGLERIAIVAVGSYGRREQCRHSDVDVMLLVEDEDASSEATQQVLYPLWDAGLKVGHSVRTVSETMQASENIETLTALLDGRLVAGDAALFAAFERERTQFATQRRGAMRKNLAQQHRELVTRERWQLQQPEIKTGRGGLRQLQSMRWIDAADALVEGVAIPPPTEDLAAAQNVILATRNALHTLTERPNDHYRQDLADGVAHWLQTTRAEWTPRLFAAMRTIDAEAVRRLDVKTAPRRRWWRRGEASSDRSAAQPAPTSEQLADDASDLDQLRAVLRADGQPSLDPLPPAEWLLRLLPEWDVLRELPHVAPFHMHPVDAHIMRTVEEARYACKTDEDGTATDAVAEALDNEDELLIASLLHDIGKGHDGDHSEVGALITERFCSRAGFDADTTRRLAAVAEHHLLLPTVATRRDIADQRVIDETASLVGDAHTLHLLYLVAVADSRATGPDVWSAWKAQLMRSLYSRVLEVLSGESPEAATAARLRLEAVVDALAGSLSRESVEQHLRGLPASYVLSTPPATVGEHIALIAEADGATAVRRDSLGTIDRITIVTPDRPGTLSLLAGTLAAHNANVLGGVAHTRDDGVAIDVMHVGDALGRGIDERRWQRILAAIPQALSGEFDVDSRLAATRATYHAVPRVQTPTTVQVDNNDSEHYSIVEVHASDRLGLLYALTRAMHELALNIHLAKVDTIGAEVVDAFYVLRENGQRIERPDEIERIQSRIEQAVAALDVVAD